MTDLYYFDPASEQEVKRALEEFCDRAVLIIELVFHRPYDVQQSFRDWFRDLVREYDKPAALLHEDPLVIAAQYTGVDANAAMSGVMGREYQQLAQKHRW
jgi:hypothetical protein